MKKNVLIIFVIIVLVVLAAVIGLALYFFMPQDLSKISDSQIVSLLQKNPDAKDYMKNHSDFKINKREVLTIKSIKAGQNGVNFREVYYGLESQDNRYIRVDLIDSTGTKGLVAVIDFKKKAVTNAFGLLLLAPAQPQNGQK